MTLRQLRELSKKRNRMLQTHSFRVQG